MSVIILNYSDNVGDVLIENEYEDYLETKMKCQKCGAEVVYIDREDYLEEWKDFEMVCDNCDQKYLIVDN